MHPSMIYHKCSTLLAILSVIAGSFVATGTLTPAFSAAVQRVSPKKLLSPQEEDPLAVTAATPADLDAIMHFWNGITCLKADIIQTSSTGQRLTGTLWFKKGSQKSKGKLRLDYQKDYKQRLFVKNGEILLVDLTDNAVSAYPASMTPADLLLKPKLVLGKDVKVVQAVKHGKTVRLVLASDADASSGTLTLYFSLESNKRLLAWQILDAEGNITEVEFEPDSVRLNDASTTPDNLF